MKSKPKRLIAKIIQAGKKGILESDLFYFHEKGDSIRKTRQRITEELKKRWWSTKKLVIKGGTYFIERTGGIEFFIVMAILVVVMSVLSFKAARVSTHAQCESIFGATIILEEDYLNE